MQILKVVVTTGPHKQEFTHYLCVAHTAWMLNNSLLTQLPAFQGFSTHPQDLRKICEKCEWDHELQKRG